MRQWIRTSVLAAVAAMSVQAFADFIWIEGEDAKCSVPANNSGWGNKEYLSGEKWMHLALDPAKVDELVKGDAVTIQYPLNVTKAGKYQVWNRLGMEFVRSNFDWRIDQGEWQTVNSEELTTDLMEIANWTEVAWLKLGEADLPAGNHVLEVRVPKTKDKDGKTQRILYACDAVCLTTDEFRPNSKYKPNESGRSEADLAAEKVVFKLPESPVGQRSTVSLGGTWEIARADEQMPKEVAVPITDLPANAVWRAIPVPSDKNKSRPDYLFAHRVWYRTRVEVPASMAGRSFFIDFPLNNLNTTVVVNGQQCGFFKDPFARFQIDVSKAVKPGEVNEILVGIRDAWYGRTADPDRPLKLRKTFNIPMSFLGQGFQDLDYPIWNCPQSGILATPSFVAAGGVYTSDVFAKPSVEKKQMIAEVTVANPGQRDVAGEIRWEALDIKSGEVAKAFAAKPFSVAAGKSQTTEISDSWADAKLWWPDQPNMYRLRTTVMVDGKAVDTSEVPFGFREWKIEGTKFTLNGIVWHLWADLIGGGSTPETWLKAHAESGVRTYRYSTAGQAPQDPHWFGLEPQQALDFMDQNGIVVRRNTTLDGETIGSKFSEDDAEIRKKQGGSKIKINLMKNWIDQCVSQVKGERNHPSIQIWTIENEFAYINLINLLGNSPEMDEYEGWIKKCHDAVMATDPTRSVMIDGGGALKDNSLGVHGDHYVNGIDGRYPDQAYEAYPEGGGRGRWKWDQKRPRFIGEDFFATGVNPADYAVFGGEVAFQGKASTRDAVATVYRMLQEGYRWGGHYAAWHFWLGGEGGPRSRVANAPRAVFTREWDWSFASGAKVKRTFGVFNDTQYPDPITFTRVLTIDGKEVYRKSSQHNVKPGTAEKFEEEIAMPAVDQRTEGELVMTLSAGGKELFRDSKAVSVLPAVVAKTSVESQGICVYDPKGSLGGFLNGAKIPHTPINSLEALPQNSRLLIVGSDAIDEKESTSTVLAAYASGGRAVIVLDQSTPLKYQAIPAEMELAADSRRGRSGEVDMSVGRTAFIEDASHPAFAGLKDKDFFTWSGDHTVYRSPYMKPTRGGKSLLQVGPRLSQTALVEVPVGKGVMYLSQLETGKKLATSPAAAHLLGNLVSHAVNYKQEVADVTAAVSNEQLAKALDAIGLQYAKSADALAAISDAERKIAIVSATPENLKVLAGNMPKLQEFWQRGGQLFLHGLTPEGLASFNQIVGVEHLIRPFGRERVTFPAVRNPLTSGLTTGDIVMLSGKRIFGWTADEYVASDVFTHVVDYDEVAPFAKSDFANYGNITNGFVGSDGWPLIIDFPAPADGKPFEIKMDLPREETITELTYDQSLNYGTTTKIALVFDGAERQEFTLQPDGDAQTFTIEPARKAKQVTLQVLAWEPAPEKANNVGIDNIYLKVQRSKEFTQTVRPMLNLGGMMQYAKGNGGVVLCNLNLLESEAVPVNQKKKRTILATVLRNLKAPFAGGKTVIVGANLDYQPIDIHTKATTYKDDRGWFGDKGHTFAGLPQGRHTFAGVQYEIYEMPTSPVPQVLMLGGQGVPNNLPKSIAGIPVNAKADALFFLHTAKIGKRPSDKERQAKEYSPMFKYVVNYADGQTADVPVLSEVNIDSYMQKEPAALPGAQLAWTRPFDGSDQQATAYAMQWNNSRPDAEIKSVDMVYVDESRGVPVLLALTAATAQ